MRHFVSWLASGMLSLLLLVPAASAQIRVQSAPKTLDQMSREAGLIVRGHILSTKVEPHPQYANIMTVVVRMQVDEALKGSPGKLFEFRQVVFGPDAGAKAYVKRSELLLMLNPVSQAGLTSPVGMEQGRFRIDYDAQGNAQAVNGRNNVGLFAGTEAKAQAAGAALSAHARQTMRSTAAGPVDLSDLRESVRAFAKASQQQ